MEKKTNKITKVKIVEAIVNEALAIKRKKKLYLEIQSIEKELGTLNEHLAGSFGFKSSNDVATQKGVTGFVNSPIIGSRIKALEEEIQNMQSEEMIKEEGKESEDAKLDRQILDTLNVLMKKVEALENKKS